MPPHTSPTAASPQRARGDAPPTPRPSTAHARLHELDLLRFLAALAVVLYHYTGTLGGPWKGESARELFGPVSTATQFGYLGVELFFLISGFVILMSVWGRDMADFATSRITRLYPAYWFAVLLVGVIHLTTGMGRGRLEDLIPNLTMFQQGMGLRNVSGVFWTLWVEMHFYALVAVLVLVGVSYQRCVTFMSTWTVSAVFARESGVDALEALLVPEYAPYFVAGMAFYLMHRFGPSLLLWGFVAFSWACALRYALPIAKGGPYNIAAANAWPTVPLVITALFVIMALVATGALRALRWRRLTTLGALTYPTYLIHYEVAPPLARVLRPALPYWAATLVLTLVVLVAASLVHRLVERPVAAWLRPRLRESFQRLRSADHGRHRGGRARRAGPQAEETADDRPATSDSQPGDPPPPPPGPEPRGSAPAPPIGSTI
jgi:peptidoglycan/LPS O-acetylase OafA/YrhL